VRPLKRPRFIRICRDKTSGTFIDVLLLQYLVPHIIPL
jgi:hypothetical protein